jgi:hypothetical protein
MAKAGRALKKMSGSKLRKAALSPGAPRRLTAKSHLVSGGKPTFRPRMGR